MAEAQTTVEKTFEFEQFHGVLEAALTNPRLQANLPQDVSGVGSQRHVLGRGTAERTATADSFETAARSNVHVQVAQNVRNADFV